MNDNGKRNFETLGMAARRLLDRIDARKASGASKAGVNSGIGCPLVPFTPAVENGGEPMPKGISKGSPQPVGPNGEGGQRERCPQREGPPGSEGKCGRGFRNQADAGEVFSEALAREPTRIRFGVLTGGVCGPSARREW